MTRFKLTACSIASILFLVGCNEILEPISFYGAKQNIATKVEQEEFEINIKSLTFKTAKEANNAQYPRQLILKGSGSEANVFDESHFLKSNFPKSSRSTKYLLGVGDQISFTQLNEFEPYIAQWPSAPKETEYLLGPGDQLSFIQSNDYNTDISIKYALEGAQIPKQKDNGLFITNGTIGINGNILLYGLGNISAANRTLEDVRTEVRNILIRDGLAPNFQLEISNFISKKAFVTIDDNYNGVQTNTAISRTIFLNSLPITLKEIALQSNLSKSMKNFAVVKLTRDLKEFRLTAEQLFNLSAPEIFIQDNDQIEINIIEKRSTNTKAIVGSKGYILIPNIGRLYALNRSIDDIHKEISSININKGIKPNFQLELEISASKKIYFVHKNVRNKVLHLTDSNTSLRQLLIGKNSTLEPLLNYNNSSIMSNSLDVLTLIRNGREFQMTVDQVLDPTTPNIWVADEDHIEIENLTYKPGQVFALGGAGNAEMVFIDPSKRETLADILFTNNGALNNLMAKRSEVYLLRGQNPSVAYHLDAQNVSRILVAAKTELRPNDIVYVADRPIISFARTLAEINPLRVLLRDIKNDNIP